jgi:ferrous iron transport protein B
MLKAVLVGNPNTGKTALFNSLTGSTAHVGNWPGVTVERKEGTYKQHGEPIQIIDLPGIYSLRPYSPEEKITRNYLENEQVDCIINIIDATNLERNLYLTTQLLELDLPIVAALNMADILATEGSTIDLEGMSKKLQIPVVLVSATKETGLEELMTQVASVAVIPRSGSSILVHSPLRVLIEQVERFLKQEKVVFPLYHGLKLLEGDEIEAKMHPLIYTQIQSLVKENQDVMEEIADARFAYLEQQIIQPFLHVTKTKKEISGSEKIDKVLTHKIWGIPLLIVILFLMFHLTFGEDLLYLNTLGLFGADGIVSFPGTAYEGLFFNGGLNSPGVIFFNFFDSSFSLITEAVRNGLSGTASWVSSFLADGVLAGLFAVLGFLPQILVLFFFFSLLEDSGYMARVTFLLDRMLRKFGLSGRAIIPMIMGFGCSVPAIMNTRTLGDEKEKIATIRVIPFFSCSAKLPILTAIAGGIVLKAGVGNVDLITSGMYLLGVVTAVLTVIIMRRTTLRGENSALLMELPNYHFPKMKSIFFHVFDKAKHFLKKAFTIILVSTMAIWLVSHLSFTQGFLENESQNSILGQFGRIISPIFTPFGFGIGGQINPEYSWIFAVAIVMGLVAKENVVATMGTLAAGLLAVEEGNEALSAVIVASGISVPALLAFISFNMLTIPCFAATATAKAEMPRPKAFWATLGFWLLTSSVVSSLVYVVGSWWWTGLILVGLLGLTFWWLFWHGKKVTRGVVSHDLA